MKTMNGSYSDTIRIIVGTAEEIEAVWKSMFRAWRNDKSNLWPSHTTYPKFNADKIYGIGIYREEDHDRFYILNEHTIIKELIGFNS